MRIFAVFLALLAMFVLPAQSEEAPLLAERVTAGKLPPEADRLPKEPRVMTIDETSGRTVGKRGGTIRTLMSEQGDLRLMTVYGYARLVAYNSSLEMQPDILLSYENDKNKVFTLHLRPGHKWSDGTPFTAEDFRFQWEDILTDKDMDRGGLDCCPASRRQGTEVRGHRRTDRPLYLGAAQSAVPAGPGGCAPARYLRRLRISEAVPRQIRRCR